MGFSSVGRGEWQDDAEAMRITLDSPKGVNPSDPVTALVGRGIAGDTAEREPGTLGAGVPWKNTGSAEVHSQAARLADRWFSGAVAEGRDP